MCQIQIQKNEQCIKYTLENYFKITCVMYFLSLISLDFLISLWIFSFIFLKVGSITFGISKCYILLFSQFLTIIMWMNLNFYFWICFPLPSNFVYFNSLFNIIFITSKHLGVFQGNKLDRNTAGCSKVDSFLLLNFPFLSF